MASATTLVPGSPDWWANRPPAPTHRRGRPPMDGDRITETALKLIDEVGAQALTLRMLADALDSGTATLYRHFNNRDELLALVADRILGEVHVPPEESAGTSWREAATLAAEAFHATLCRHPRAVPLLAAQVPVGPNALRARERLLGLFLHHGFSVRLAARAYTALGHYVTGFAIQQYGPGTPLHEDQLRLRVYYRALDSAAYPATTAAADDLTSVRLPEEFRFGLELLLDGLEQARLRESQVRGDTVEH
ncbi:TetR/AcrR family transcriptional regulator C-terminal domain-containing protein [Streptomyces europaeiscabiei]|uniref:TetR/AcrR family transcriptional regulator C-terminal domain-containing protein n=1 Tax=Streptomyces europaeiscabiei TaxID=146819 RepID=A0AAJ2PSR5_9ACTN|nr:TetR/AcrR family transcriptional regulator C-terminal domain-containing protein [Streptomyces europaeiscabiei]MDX3132832.1 TetR/AcrR family transcriptional regulator C-terminal domain-containing protein [Streptomyces europaeiscabiei]